MTALALTLLVGRRPGLGPVVWEISSTHGLHLGDLPVIALWVLGMVCGALLLRDRRPERPT